MDEKEKARIKLSKAYGEQIQILKSSNLIIEDEQFARDVLSQINY